MATGDEKQWCFLLRQERRYCNYSCTYVCMYVCHAPEWVWHIWPDVRFGLSTTYSVAVYMPLILS